MQELFYIILLHTRLAWSIRYGDMKKLETITFRPKQDVCQLIMDATYDTRGNEIRGLRSRICNESIRAFFKKASNIKAVAAIKSM